jgi:hypothetical protein
LLFSYSGFFENALTNCNLQAHGYSINVMCLGLVNQVS